MKKKSKKKKVDRTKARIAKLRELSAKHIAKAEHFQNKAKELETLGSDEAVALVKKAARLRKQLDEAEQQMADRGIDS